MDIKKQNYIEQNYYEFREDSGDNFTPVKLIKKTDSEYTIEIIPLKQKKTFFKGYCDLQEISIESAHLEKLGLKKDNRYVENNGIKVLPVYECLGDLVQTSSIPSKTSGYCDHFGYKVIKSECAEKFNEKRRAVIESLPHSNIEYQESRLKYKKCVAKKLVLISNINELFESLEKLGFKIDNKSAVLQ